MFKGFSFTPSRLDVHDQNQYLQQNNQILYMRLQNNGKDQK